MKATWAVMALAVLILVACLARGPQRRCYDCASVTPFDPTRVDPLSSNRRTAVFEAVYRGSNPRAGAHSSVAKWQGARLLTGRSQVRLLPLEQMLFMVS